VLLDPRASRSQAMIYVDGGRPKLLVLGRGKTTVNDVGVTSETRLDSGDRIGVPGLELHVLASLNDAQQDEEGWVLDRPGGGLVALSHAPFVVGGDASDDLCVHGWEKHAITLHLAQGRLLLVPDVTVEVDGVAVRKGGVVALAPGSRIAHAGQSLRVIAGGDFGAASTVVTDARAEGELPDRVELEFLPRGGRLRVRARSKQYGLFLPGQRCDLMAVLLRPPEPHRPGDVLADDLVISRVWPTQSRTRIDLNTLIYRLRRDLVRAGIDATTFIVRAAGGGGTRLGLAKDVDIRVA
jgi:hypothetical protein